MHFIADAEREWRKYKREQTIIAKLFFKIKITFLSAEET